MKLFPTKCHEWATLWKLWCQMWSRSLFPAKCWPLLHVIRACSWRWPNVVTRKSTHFSKFAFVFIKLFLLYNKSLNDWSLGQQWILFPSTLSWETLRFLGNKIHCSPQDQSLSVYYNIASKLTQFQPSNLLLSSASSIILWKETDDAMKPMKYISSSFQWIWIN